MNNQPLVATIRKEGVAFWKDPKDHASAVLLNAVTSLSQEDLESFVRFKRRLGQTFQACLLACRHFLEGKSVAFLSENVMMADNALNQCKKILEESFPDGLVYNRSKLGLSVFGKQNQGDLIFATDLDAFYGRVFDEIIIDRYTDRSLSKFYKTSDYSIHIKKNKVTYADSHLMKILRN